MIFVSSGTEFVQLRYNQKPSGAGVTYVLQRLINKSVTRLWRTKLKDKFRIEITTVLQIIKRQLIGKKLYFKLYLQVLIILIFIIFF